MDQLDRDILAALRKNARTPVSAIATALGTARPTVQHRITRMQNAGVITGYTITVGPGATTTPVRAVMAIAVEGGVARDVVRDLHSRPCVIAVHSTNGKWDIIAELQAESLEDFDRELNSIRALPRISASETNLLLSTYRG